MTFVSSYISLITTRGSIYADSGCINFEAADNEHCSDPKIPEMAR